MYGEPLVGSEEVDRLAPALHQDGENLLMQVVRAETEEEITYMEVTSPGWSKSYHDVSRGGLEIIRKAYEQELIVTR